MAFPVIQGGDAGRDPGAEEGSGGGIQDRCWMSGLQGLLTDRRWGEGKRRKHVGFLAGAPESMAVLILSGSEGAGQGGRDHGPPVETPVRKEPRRGQ